MTRKIFTIILVGILTGNFTAIPVWAAVIDNSLLAQRTTRFSAMAVAGSNQEEMVSRLMVKPHSQNGKQLNLSLHSRDASKLAEISKVLLSVVRPMSGNAHVISLANPVTLSEAHAIAARLMQDSSVESAEPDRLKYPMATPAVIPADPDYATYQWNLKTPSSSNLGSANLPDAWGITTGSSAVTVAVIDTGYRPHADLGSVILPGYDFITDVATANDGDGRDPDAQDSGDWITANENSYRHGSTFRGCGVSDSSWHGTHVAGIIAAQMNNGIGITGVAPNVKILPVRVLGKCGGYDSDIIDGMRWAAGIAVAGVPANAHPAQVLNMSLGGTGGSPCSQAYQSAVTDIVNTGKVIVVAAGNDGRSIISSPANCTGVIAVTANAIDGDNSWYATIGPGTTISAPGGDCGGMNPYCNTANYPGVYSLLNSGLTTPVASPGGDIYGAYSGTSMATPEVAAVAALMLSINPALTPAQIKSTLQSSARPFPPNTICTPPNSNPGDCGAGLLDAYQALLAVSSLSNLPLPDAPIIGLASAGNASATVTFNAPTNNGGSPITGYTVTSSPAGGVDSNAGSTVLNHTITGLTNGTSYTFTVHATNASGNSTESLASNGVTPLNPVQTIASVDIVSGWNLLGNGIDVPLVVTNALGDASKVTSVWKWLDASSQWAFYSPTMDSSSLATYVNSKGYVALDTINGGEGFWVNARMPFTISMPAGSAINSSHFADKAIPPNNLPSGWSLIAVGDNPTPRNFVNTISLTTPQLPAVAATSLLTLWAWDSGTGNWYFYSPILDNSSGLVNYISNNGYLDFTARNKKLDAATGFWVHHP